LHSSETALHKLVRTLEVSLDGRSGVFFIGRLESTGQHEKVAQALSRRLEQREIPVARHSFYTPSEPSQETSFEDFVKVLTNIKAKGSRSVLVVWSLEHLENQKLIETMRKFNAHRGWLSQSKAGTASVPVVLLVDQATYREYLVRWAGDLLDCLPPSFDLS
jgi:hypothetical protein